MNRQSGKFEIFLHSSSPKGKIVAVSHGKSTATVGSTFYSGHSYIRVME